MQTKRGYRSSWRFHGDAGATRPGALPGRSGMLRISWKPPEAAPRPSTNSWTDRWATSPSEPRSGRRPERSPAGSGNRPCMSWKAGGFQVERQPGPREPRYNRPGNRRPRAAARRRGTPGERGPRETRSLREGPSEGPWKPGGTPHRWGNGSLYPSRTRGSYPAGPAGRQPGAHGTRIPLAAGARSSSRNGTATST